MRIGVGKYVSIDDVLAWAKDGPEAKGSDGVGQARVPAYCPLAEAFSHIAGERVRVYGATIMCGYNWPSRPTENEPWIGRVATEVDRNRAIGQVVTRAAFVAILLDTKDWMNKEGDYADEPAG